MLTKKYHSLFILSFIFFSIPIFAQNQTSDSSVASQENRYSKNKPLMIYPLIKGSKMVGVIPVESIRNKPDPEKEIKLIFDFTQVTSNNEQGSRLNEGLEEVARTMNLHVAAGIKKEKLRTVIIFHSGSVFSVLNNNYYQKKYNSSNPNIDMLQQLVKAGTELVICGQSMTLREVKPAELLPQIQIALSAKTTLSKYQTKGYIINKISEK